MGIFDFLRGGALKPFEEFYENGSLKIKGFKDKNDLMSGLIQYFSKNDFLSKESNYKNGKKEGIEKEFYESGAIKIIRNFKSNFLDGDVKFYTRTGKLTSQYRYKNGLLDGRYDIFDENEDIKESGLFKNDVKINPTTNSPIYSENIREEGGEKDENGNKKGLWKRYKTNDKGITEYLVREDIWVDHPELGSIASVRCLEKVYYETGNLEQYKNSRLDEKSDEFFDAKKVSGYNEIRHLNIFYHENGNISHKRIGLKDDENSWYEEIYFKDGKLHSKGHNKHGLKSGNWKLFHNETKKNIVKYFFPVVVDIIDCESPGIEKGDKMAFSVSDDILDLTTLNKSQVVIWSNQYGEIDRGCPIGDGVFKIDTKNLYTPEKLKTKHIKKLFPDDSRFEIKTNWNSEIISIKKLISNEIERKIDEIYESMVTKIKSFDRDDDLEYWFKINLETANNEMVKMSKETIYSKHTDKLNSLTHQMLDLLTGHYDEYETKMGESSFEDQKEFIGMRIISFGAIFGFYEEILEEITSILEKNNLDLSEKVDKLNYEMMHCKSRLYGSIKFALEKNIPKEIISEWYGNFIDNEILYYGLPIEFVNVSDDQITSIIEEYRELEYILSNNLLDKEITNGINNAFNCFKENNPEIEKTSSSYLISMWHDFIKFCYCKTKWNESEDEFSNSHENELTDLVPKNFKLNDLMLEAHSEAESEFYENYQDLLNLARKISVSEENAKNLINKIKEELISDFEVENFRKLYDI